MVEGEPVFERAQEGWAFELRRGDTFEVDEEAGRVRLASGQRAGVYRLVDVRRDATETCYVVGDCLAAGGGERWADDATAEKTGYPFPSLEEEQARLENDYRSLTGGMPLPSGPYGVGYDQTLRWWRELNRHLRRGTAPRPN